jgi:hypothetical protein
MRICRHPIALSTPSRKEKSQGKNFSVIARNRRREILLSLPKPHLDPLAIVSPSPTSSPLLPRRSSLLLHPKIPPTSLVSRCIYICISRSTSRRNRSSLRRNTLPRTGAPQNKHVLEVQLPGMPSAPRAVTLAKATLSPGGSSRAGKPRSVGESPPWLKSPTSSARLGVAHQRRVSSSINRCPGRASASSSTAAAVAPAPPTLPAASTVPEHVVRIPAPHMPSDSGLISSAPLVVRIPYPGGVIDATLPPAQSSSP